MCLISWILKITEIVAAQLAASSVFFSFQTCSKAAEMPSQRGGP